MDVLEAIGDPGLREALLFTRAQAAPVSADELAEATGVHRNVARARLERLARSGLLVPAFERRTGRTGPGAGRPAKVYTVATQAAAVEFPARGYEQLIGLIASELPEREREPILRSAGAAFGRGLARTAGLRPVVDLPTGADRLCAAVRSLGFHATLEDAGRDEARLTTRTCPLRAVLRAAPDAAALDHGMWAGLVESAVRGVGAVEVECETRDCLAEGRPCSVRLAVESRAGA